MFKKEEEGYFSVEASFLLPFLTLIIWFFIMTGFFLYNVSYLQQSAYVAAIRGASLKREGRSVIEMQTKSYVDELLKEKLILVDDWNSTIKIDSNHVTVTIEAIIEQPVFSILSEKLGSWEIKVKSRAIRDNPVKIIRNEKRN